MTTQTPTVNLGSTPTLASVSAQVAALAQQVATLQAQAQGLGVASQAQGQSIATLQLALGDVQARLAALHALALDTQSSAMNAEIAAARG